MRGTGALLSAKSKLKPIYLVTGSRGRVATTTPKKKINEDSPERRAGTKEEAEPTVAFGKPPPLPPVLGPLVALSLLETWSSRDGDDD